LVGDAEDDKTDDVNTSHNYPDLEITTKHALQTLPAQLPPNKGNLATDRPRPAADPFVREMAKKPEEKKESEKPKEDKKVRSSSAVMQGPRSAPFRPSRRAPYPREALEACAHSLPAPRTDVRAGRRCAGKR